MVRVSSHWGLRERKRGRKKMENMESRERLFSNKQGLWGRMLDFTQPRLIQEWTGIDRQISRRVAGPWMSAERHTSCDDVNIREKEPPMKKDFDKRIQWRLWRRWAMQILMHAERRVRRRVYNLMKMIKKKRGRWRRRTNVEWSRVEHTGRSLDNSTAVVRRFCTRPQTTNRRIGTSRLSNNEVLSDWKDFVQLTKRSFQSIPLTICENQNYFQFTQMTAETSFEGALHLYRLLRYQESDL